MKRSWPPEFHVMPKLYKRGFGNEPIHKLFVSEEFLKIRLLRPFIQAHAKDTAVMDVLNKVASDMVNCVKQVNCSWRWKIMRLLPRNMVDRKRFVQNCELNREHITRVVEVIYHDIFPVGHFGSTNAVVLIKLIVDYLWDCEIKEIPSLQPLHISYLRAMKCVDFKANLLKVGLSSAIESIYNMACRAFLELAHEVVVGISLMFIERVNERHRPRADGFPSYYSKQCFNFWKKKELKMFKADYVLVNSGTDQPDKAILSKTVVVPSRSSMRPICPFSRSMYNWNVYNEARELNAILDYHLRNNCCGYPPSKGLYYIFRDIRCYLKGIPEGQELFFVKTDVTKAFANINRRLLDDCLKELVGARKCVTVTRTVSSVEPNIKPRFDLVAAGINADLAQEYLARLVRRKRKKFTDPVEKSKINDWSAPNFGMTLWKMIERLRFRVGTKPKLYRMKRGVPQGFYLSSRLSHIYLSSFDRHLTQFNVKTFRYVDDYLFITKTKEDAVNLLDFLQRPVNGYGIQFRREKTETSFSCDYVQKPTAEMIWCGGRLNTKQRKFTTKTANSLVMYKKKVSELHFNERCLLRNKWTQQEHRLYKLYNEENTM